jgi:hypothetical protein
MIIPLGSLITFEELAAWQSRLPRNRRYSVHELLSLYNEPIEIGSSLEKIYIEIPPKRRGR